MAPLSVSEAMQYIEAGRLKGLGATGSRAIKVKGSPEILTSKEQGFPAEAPIVGYLMAPKDVPQDRIQFLHDAFKKGMDDKHFKKMTGALNIQVAYLDGKAARERFSRFYEHYGKLIKSLGLSQKK